MKHIDEHRDVEACILIWDDESVKQFHRDFRIGTDENVDAMDGDVRTCLLNEMVNDSVTTTNVENASMRREESRQMFGKNGVSTGQTMVSMYFASNRNRGHIRFAVVLRASCPAHLEESWTE